MKWLNIVRGILLSFEVAQIEPFCSKIEHCVMITTDGIPIKLCVEIEVRV